MAKTASEQPKDVNEQVAFQTAWDKDPALRALTTRTGQMRGGLGPKQRETAIEILQKYGL